MGLIAQALVHSWHLSPIISLEGRLHGFLFTCHFSVIMIPWLDILWCTTIAISVKLLFFVIQRRKDHQRFIKRGIPGPKPSLLAGNMYQLEDGKELAHSVMDRWFAEYGDFFGYYRGETRHLVIRDLEILRTIF